MEGDEERPEDAYQPAAPDLPGRTPAPLRAHRGTLRRHAGLIARLAGARAPDASRPGARASTRVRHWGSCFDPDHARIHGANFRPRVRERYRQWLVHKLGTWVEQFGESGCVGCGRCLTWCPVAIDLTDEVAAIREEADGAEDP
ncbi:MAG: hypothetical protein D6685_18875 [Bacteroidetes bacterium]|nr:MAG: hypothetical protein D6685_18875 [Bacteroidota bacterium]